MNDDEMIEGMADNPKSTLIKMTIPSFFHRMPSFKHISRFLLG